MNQMRKTMLELFDKIQFMRNFSTMHKTSYEDYGLDLTDRKPVGKQTE